MSKVSRISPEFRISRPNFHSKCLNKQIPFGTPDTVLGHNWPTQETLLASVYQDIFDHFCILYVLRFVFRKFRISSNFHNSPIYAILYFKATPFINMYIKQKSNAYSTTYHIKENS